MQLLIFIQYRKLSLKELLLARNMIVIQPTNHLVLVVEVGIQQDDSEVIMNLLWTEDFVQAKEIMTLNTRYASLTVILTEEEEIALKKFMKRNVVVKRLSEQKEKVSCGIK